MIIVTEIKIEYLKNPIGIKGMPRFSWVLESDKRGVMQCAYQLQLSKDRLFQETLYDSGWVEGCFLDSAHVTVKGVELVSCTRYYVRVRVRDKEEESPYSKPASFVTALLKPSEWRAEFISAETPKDKDCSKATYLRTEIEVKGEVEEAFVCTTALGLYHYYINGEKVGRDEMAPGWTSYHKHLCYQTYDVTKLLKPGKNALAAIVGAGWYKGKMGFLHLRNNYGEQTAFLMQMVIRYRSTVEGGTSTEVRTSTEARISTEVRTSTEGGTSAEEWFYTDGNWQGHDAPVTFSEIYDGEIYDGRLEVPGWNEAGLKTKDWRRVSVIPWNGDIPLSRHVLSAQPGSRVTTMDEIPAGEIITTPLGSRVLDFKQNLTGWVHFKVRGRIGDVVHLKCFETLDYNGNVYTANLRKAKQEIYYICGDQEIHYYHPYFTFQGFRYVEVVNWPGELCKEDFTAFTLHSEMEQTGTFSCSHPLINQLHHNILWSLKGNFLDIPTDCPQRDERMGWTGDAQIFSRTACYLVNAYTFFRKWLKDVAFDQTKDGGVPHVVPDIISGKEEGDWLLSKGTHSAAAWADVAVILPWNMYLTYGDKLILEEQYESMKKWIEFMREHSVEDIWNYKLQFGDWVALDRKNENSTEEGSYFGATPNDLTCTAYYAYSTGIFAKITRVLGRTEDEEEYTALYERIRRKFQDTFFLEDGTMSVMTQTAHIVALYFNLVPGHFKEKTAENLVSLLAKEDGHLVTGFVGTPYFCHALSQNGYIKEAYDLLCKEDFPSWLYQVKMGATTIWEHWDGMKPDGTMWSPDMNSFNHYCYGAVGEWLYRVVLGMEIDEKDPGYHHCIICPQTGDVLTFAEGSYETIYGRLSVLWERLPEHKIALSVTIPHNTTAEIYLEPGGEVLEPDELLFSLEPYGYQNGIPRQKAFCGSGSWKVVYRCKN